MSMPPPNHNSDLVSSSNLSLASSSLLIPRGFHFTPTDQEIISYYLSRFLQDTRNIPLDVPIHRVNIYESTPENLSKEYKRGNENFEWFFLTERTKKSEGGKYHIRTDTGGGHWKAITAGEEIEAGDGVVGYKTPLEYHTGTTKNSVKTDWLMLEYSCNSYGHNGKVDYALCKIYLTPRRTKRIAGNEKMKKKKKKKKTEVAEALQEKVDQPLDQPQQQACNNGYQVPVDSHQPQAEIRDLDEFMTLDELNALFNFEPEPEIPNNVCDVEPQGLNLDACEEFKSCDFLDDEFDEMINLFC